MPPPGSGGSAGAGFGGGRGGEATAEGVGESISNLQLAWEVVHNPRFALGTGEADAAWARARLPRGEQQQLVGVRAGVWVGGSVWVQVWLIVCYLASLATIWGA